MEAINARIRYRKGDREHIQPPKQKSILEKDRQAQFFHKFGAISKASKVLTSEMKHTGDPQDAVRLQNLFPLPSENYESPIQLHHNPPHHWPSDDEILEIWNTPEMEERARKYHSIVALLKYIRSRPLLCAPDVDGWRMKDQFQRIFLSSDPDNDELKALIHDCFYMPWLTGAFLPDFAPELAGSYLIALEKPNGGIRGIAPVIFGEGQRATLLFRRFNQ